jgi:hypothetical protein
MKNREILDNFGKILIEEVRDRVLHLGELIRDGHMNSIENKDLYNRIKKLSPECQEVLKDFACALVDKTIHHSLWMIEQNDEYDLVKYSKDKSPPLSLRDISDGLCAELYTEDGWIEKYSKYPPTIK